MLLFFIVALPNRDRLHARHVQCPIHCSLCDAFEESEWHIFFDCPTSVVCWYEAGLSHIVQNRCMRFTLTGGVLMDTCARGTGEVVGRALMVIWGIWQNRNNCVWNQAMSSVSQIVAGALVLLAEWKSVKQIKQNVAVSVSNVDI